VKPFETRFERLELKYLIDEGTAAGVRQAIRPYCRPDIHNALGRGQGPVRSRGYPIRSLYLDSPSLALHRAKERGDAERFKLRIRHYEGLDAVSIEYKRRVADLIQKTRILAEPEDLRAAVRGLGRLKEETPQARDFLRRYASLVLVTGAEPTLLVRYHREAYSSQVDANARVTFDREIAFQRVCDWTLDGEPNRWCELEGHLTRPAPRPLVVLELKCGVSVPHWMVDVIRNFELRRDSVSKYSLGIYVTRRREGASPGQERARGVLR
jgi:hypothetical protein